MTRCCSGFVLVLVLALLALTACSTPAGLLDVCDGTDGDGDGIVDEGSGEAIGCSAREVCVAGACATVCGDGFCDSANAETCSTCRGDCGACPVCGDGSCNGSETCSSCRADCPLCPGECEPCGPGFTCGGGLECGLRFCDGAAACYSPSADSTCEEVGGVPCPEVSAYNRCTSDAQCGPRMSCSAGRCAPLSVTMPIDADYCGTGQFWCPPAPQSPAGVTAECSRACVSHREICALGCVLRCTSTCPYGMHCNTATNYCTD